MMKPVDFLSTGFTQLKFLFTITNVTFSESIFITSSKSINVIYYNSVSLRIRKLPLLKVHIV